MGVWECLSRKINLIDLDHTINLLSVSVRIYLLQRYSHTPILPYSHTFLYFFTITQALCPPNPKVLLSAAFTVRF